MTSLKDGEDFLRSSDKIPIRALSSVPSCQGGAACAPPPANGNAVQSDDRNADLHVADQETLLCTVEQSERSCT